MVPLSMTLTSDPDFKVTTFLKSNIVKTACLKDKVTIAQSRKLYLAMCGRKNFHIGVAYIYSPGLNYYSRIFFKSLSYLYEVVRTNFSADFFDFHNFGPQFRENCGAI